jgi:phage terminase large subunit-like protein
VSGKIVAGKLVILACERHLRDLADGAGRGLRYCPAEAEAAVELWRLCPHVKGRRWSGETIQPEPWQQFVIRSVYGWKRADGRRRFRVIWLEMARKQGKSTMVYPAIFHGLLVDGEPGAEVFSLATKKDQAKIVYSLARQAVLKVPEFSESIIPYRNTLLVEETDSKAEALGADADTLDGLNPSVVICDELHKWRGRDLWDVVDTATGARDQPLIWVVTTAGCEGTEDVYGQEHEYTRQVLEGVIEDDSRFGFIACLDPGDDWTDPKNFIKANPNLGVSVQKAEIEQQVQKAVKSPQAQAAVKRLRLGIRSQDADAWIPLDLWDAGRRKINWADFKGAPCGAGLDLASSCDFAALSLCFPVDDAGAGRLVPAREFDRPFGYLFKWRLWIPKGWQTPAEEKLRRMVSPWSPAWVTMTEGDVIDHDLIERAVIADAEEFGVQLLAFDPWNATMLANHLAEAGIVVRKFEQRLAAFAGPTKKYGELLAGRRFFHDGNPCARWMADNCVVIKNGAEQMMPSRKKSRNKIDGVVASVMSLGAVIESDAPQENFYENNAPEFV